MRTVMTNAPTAYLIRQRFRSRGPRTQHRAVPICQKRRLNYPLSLRCDEMMTQEAARNSVQTPRQSSGANGQPAPALARQLLARGQIRRGNQMEARQRRFPRNTDPNARAQRLGGGNADWG